MTLTEIQNFQEAFIIANGFSIELSLAMLMVLAVFIAVIWLFSIKKPIRR